ncbi:hypothetical protein FG386_001097 [Cryptosporidium ryanae]|uniref:uncharacterized protein n=1 Tax=Cryptosporidium ryanae TaxID=515981 RepID=UPI00351A2C05|nr:hypothetical protein FG386_001097 [Cryptosporidium ryanae]
MPVGELDKDRIGIFQLPSFEYLIGDNNISINKLKVDNSKIGAYQRFNYEYNDLNDTIKSSILETEKIIKSVFHKDTFSVIDSTFSDNEDKKILLDSNIKSDRSEVTNEESKIYEYNKVHDDIFPFLEKNVNFDEIKDNSLDERKYSLLSKEYDENNLDKYEFVDLDIDSLKHKRDNLNQDQNSISSEMDLFDENISIDYGFDDYSISSEDKDENRKNEEVNEDDSYDINLSEINWPEKVSEEELDIIDDISEIELNNNYIGYQKNLIYSTITPVNNKELNEFELSNKSNYTEKSNKLDDSLTGTEIRGKTQEYTRIKKWLNITSGNRIHSYLSFLRNSTTQSNNSNFISSNTMKYIFKGVFRRGSYSSGSFNSNIVNSFGRIITSSESRKKSIEGFVPFENKRNLNVNLNLQSIQETRKSLKQRNLPMRIPTRYQINNKTRRIRDNDVGVIWLIREIYLSLTTQIIKISMSPDGLWLILGTQDGHIREWKFREEDLYNLNTNTEPLFNEKEDLLLNAHMNAIISLQWDFDVKSRRFLSSSMDRTVKLWEAGNREPSATINCSDWPTSVSFHPIQKNVIFIGSLDASVQIIRLIPELEDNHKKKNVDSKVENLSSIILNNNPIKYQPKVIDTIRVQDLLTALSISPNGKYLACGFKDGGVAFYDSRTLKYRCDVDCRNRRGKSAKGRKVSGISWKEDNKSVLVTTNDSRIRLFNFRDLSTFIKFKGHINKEILLSAQISNDEKFIVCGSENGYICFWNLQDENRNSYLNYSFSKYSNYDSCDKNSINNNQFVFMQDKSNIRRGPTKQCVDSFKAFDSSLTSIILAPPSFTKKIIRYFKLNSRNSSKFNYPKFTTNNTEKNTHTIIAVNRNGQIRIFVNISN